MTSKTTKTTKTQYALIGWTIVQIIGIDAETGMILAETLDGQAVMANRGDFLPLVTRRPVAVRVILGDEIVAAQVGSVSQTDTNGNRWAVCKVNGELIVVHASRVLVN